MEPNTRARTRQLERHGAASIRALSASLLADYRARRLRIDGQPVPFATPYLAADFGEVSAVRSRGISDAMAARLRYGDQALHRELAPEAPFARVVFDILEQLRCESQVPPTMAGVRRNLDEAFHQWCLGARADGMVESSIGILLYTLIHIVRARLINNTDDEEVAGLIEATRANLSPLIGKPFYQLAKTREDQAGYAVSALEIAATLNDMAGRELNDAADTETTLAKSTVMLGPDWDSQEFETALEGIGGGGGEGVAVTEETLDTVGDYRVFTTEFDQVVTGDSLYRLAQRQQLRDGLDRQVKGQAVSVTRLALRLQRLFAVPQTDGWLFGQDEGLLDGRRLSQLVSNPAYHQVFVRDRLQPVSDTVVSFLIDNSGSMKSQRFEAVAVLVDTCARALELSGTKSEILGFTTGDWNGGEVMKAWRKQGMPPEPGRLNQSLHVVYKEADISWKRSRLSIASLMKTVHFREGLDGEALIWAWRRLAARTERRKILVVVSDGAPLDAATHNNNRDGFLSDHLYSVAAFLQKQPDVEIGAIGIDLDLSDLYRNTISLNLEGTLTNQSYASLETLFGVHRA